MKTCAELCVVIFCILCATGSYAASNCSVSATGVNFGNYDVFSAVPLDSRGTLTVTCTAPWPFVSISIGPSSNSGMFNPRKMKKTTGSDLLSYNVFTDSSMSAVWGDGSAGTQTVVHQPNKKTVPEIIYARIVPGQDVTAGAYSDVLTVSINW